MRNLTKFAVVVVALGGGVALSLKHTVKGTDGAQRSLASVPEKIIQMPQSENLADKDFVAYHFERAVRAELKEKSLKPLLDIKLDGTVFVTELSRTEQSRLVQLQFSLTEGALPKIHESRVPFVAEISRDQKILSLKTGTAIEPSDEDDFNVMKDFLSLYAYNSNRDTFGTYQFKLNRTGDQIEKIKLKYDGGGPQVKLSSSKTLAKVEPSTQIWESGKGSEESRMDGIGATSSLITASSYRIEKISSLGLARPDIVGSLKDLRDTSLALGGHPQGEVRSWFELKAELAQIKKMSKSERLSLFHDLAKLLKSDPKVLGEFKAYIESMSKETGFMTFGIGVIATAGTPSAQAVLREWYGAGYGVEHTVLNAFTSASATMTPETRTFLGEIVAKRASNPELAENALFAVGSSLRQNADPEAQKLVLGYYAQSKTESDRLSALDAIGNSGDANFLPTLRSALNSDNPSERERAVFAVRNLPAESAAPIIKTSYESGDPGLRKASVRALAFQQTLAPHAAVIRECAQAGESVCMGMLARLNE